METFSALLVICAGNSPVPGEFPTQRPVTRGFDVLYDLRPNKRLSKQTRGWWFETLSCSLWRHCNDFTILHMGRSASGSYTHVAYLLVYKSVIAVEWHNIPLGHCNITLTRKARSGNKYHGLGEYLAICIWQRPNSYKCTFHRPRHS